MSGVEQQNQDGVKFCSNCGTPRKSMTSNFCANCGNSFLTKSASLGLQNNITKTIPPQPVVQDPYVDKQNFYPPENYRQQYPSDFITPNQIMEVKEPIFVNNEIKIILIMGLTGYISHILRYLLIYNRFPAIFDLLAPLPIYLLIAIILAGFDKKIFQQKGVDTNINADPFDYTVSLVLSSFFLTSLNFQVSINQETSTVPENVYIAENTNMGINYLQIPRATYIGQYVRPNTLFKSTFFILIFAGAGLFLYFNPIWGNIIILTRLVTAYLGGLALTNVSPRLGRYNEEMSKVGRYRTLFLFLTALFITFAALVGEDFFIAL